MEWYSLHNHTHFSLLDGLSSPSKIAQRCETLGMKAFAVTDHGGVAGVPQVNKLLQKKKIKVINGNEFYLSQQDSTIHDKTNRPSAHLVVLAKDAEGWKNLIRATSESNKPEHFYYKPHLNLERLAAFSNGKFITFSGHPGSDLANVCFTDYKAAYRARTYEDAKKLVRGDWEQAVLNSAKHYMDLFGRENFYFEIQLVDKENIPATEIISKILRYVGKKENIPCVATADAHYPTKEDAVDQRVLLCSRFQTTLNEIAQQIKDEDDGDVMGFFRSNNYHIPSLAEMEELHKGFEVELENSVKIADTCDSYNILGKPELPQFDTQGNGTPEEYFRHLCREGWKNKIEGKIPKDKIPLYTERVKHELSVLAGAGLSSYFLIVRDYIQESVGRGDLVVVRGSATGCMVSYLIGISDVDPIPYGLIFERFYNAGRNTKDHVALPDIDGDFPTATREITIEYIKNKYGRERVGQVATFGRMQGRAALKDVLRAHSACTYEEMNRITEFIPDESKISDELQQMREDGQEPSIIQWSLEHNKKELEEWCFIDDQGNLSGSMWKYFAQAKRLEGTKRSQGKHAAALVISPRPLDECCPMIYDKSTGQSICGIEYADLENMGMVKFDILGTTVLDKLGGVKRLLATGK